MAQQNNLNLILRAIQAAQTPGQILEVAIDHLLQVSWLGLHTGAAGFLLRGQQLRKIVSRNLPPTVERDCTQLALGQCLCGRVAETGESIIEPMRTREPVISWDEILLLGAQIARLPLNEDAAVNTKTIIGPSAAIPLGTMEIF